MAPPMFLAPLNPSGILQSPFPFWSSKVLLTAVGMLGLCK
jgi:hypothetical protein